MLKPLFIVSLVLLSFAGNAARAKTISNPSTGYTFDLPDNWVEIPKAEVDALVNKVAEPGAAQFLAGYEPAENPQHFAYPYMLVQFIPHPPSDSISERDLKQVCTEIAGLSDADVKKTLKPQAQSLVGSLGSKSASYFTNPPGITIDMDLSVTNIGNVHDHGIALVGKSNLIAVHIYFKPDSATAMAPVIETLASSFHLDADKQAEFNAGLFSSTSAMEWGGAAIFVLVFGFVIRAIGKKSARPKA